MGESGERGWGDHLGELGPLSEHSRLLELQDSVLDVKLPEVHLPLLDDLDVVVVWNHDNEPGKIKKLREHVEDTQDLMKPSDSLTLTGSLKGYGKGETMVTFVVSPDSFFGSVMFPWFKDNGDVDGGDSSPLAVPATPLSVPVVPLVGQDDANLLERVGNDPYEETEGVQDGGASITLARPVVPLVVQDATNPLKPDPAGSGDRRRLQKNKKVKTKTEVDLLVLYTPAAAKAMGGKGATMNKIVNMIAVTNEIYANSYIHINIRLVGVEKVNYKETPSNSTSLDDLFEGKVPDSARMRTEYGADLVQMVTIDSSFCGEAVAPFVGEWTAETGVSVVSTKCMRRTSAHEIGHNFGCDHDYYSSVKVEKYKYNGLASREVLREISHDPQTLTLVPDSACFPSLASAPACDPTRTIDPLVLNHDDSDDYHPDYKAIRTMNDYGKAVMHGMSGLHKAV
eukprot:gene30649-35664_t